MLYHPSPLGSLPTGGGHKHHQNAPVISGRLFLRGSFLIVEVQQEYQPPQKVQKICMKAVTCGVSFVRNKVLWQSRRGNSCVLGWGCKGKVVLCSVNGEQHASVEGREG